MEYKVKKNVLRFDVSMYDFFHVNVVKSFTDFSNDWANFVFLHSPVFTDHLQKLSICTELNQKIQVLFVLKETVKRSYVTMRQKELNTQLSCNLILILLGLYLLLGHYFHSTDKAS